MTVPPTVYTVQVLARIRERAARHAPAGRL